MLWIYRLLVYFCIFLHTMFGTENGRPCCETVVFVSVRGFLFKIYIFALSANYGHFQLYSHVWSVGISLAQVLIAGGNDFSKPLAWYTARNKTCFTCNFLGWKEKKETCGWKGGCVAIFTPAVFSSPKFGPFDLQFQNRIIKQKRRGKTKKGMNNKKKYIYMQRKTKIEVTKWPRQKWPLSSPREDLFRGRGLWPFSTWPFLVSNIVHVYMYMLIYVYEYI